MKRIEDSLRDLWDNIKHTNICIIGVPEEEEKKKWSEKILEEIIVKNVPNMGKEIEDTRKDDYTKVKLLREDQKELKDFGERNRKMKIFLFQT